MRVSLEVGIGGWSFYREITLRVIPYVGSRIAASGDGRVYTVSSVTITPDTVYVRCHEPFQSEEEAIEAGKEWPEIEAARGLDGVRKLTEETREEWRHKSRQVTKSLEIEADALARALGTISWEEAVEGFKRNAVEIIKRVMQ